MPGRHSSARAQVMPLSPLHSIPLAISTEGWWGAVWAPQGAWRRLRCRRHLDRPDTFLEPFPSARSPAATESPIPSTCLRCALSCVLFGAQLSLMCFTARSLLKCCAAQQRANKHIPTYKHAHSAPLADGIVCSGSAVHFGKVHVEPFLRHLVGRLVPDGR